MEILEPRCPIDCAAHASVGDTHRDGLVLLGAAAVVAMAVFAGGAVFGYALAMASVGGEQAQQEKAQ